MNHPSLLETLVYHHDAASRAAADAHEAALDRYWAAALAIASGDRTGQADPDQCRDDLALLGLTIEHLKTDVAAIASVRAAQQQHDDACKALPAAQEAHKAVLEAETTAQAALDAAHQAVLEAAGRVGAAQGARNTAVVRLREVRKVASALADRGLTAELLRPAPPQPPLMVRYIRAIPGVWFGARRELGDVFEIPIGTTLDPQAVQLADLPWPTPTVRRRFRACSSFNDVILGRRGPKEVFVADVPVSMPLPWFVQILPDEPAPAAAPAAVDLVTSPAPVLHETVTATATADQLDVLLDVLHDGQQDDEEQHE